MKILLISDREGWAFDNRCKALKKHLDYDFDLIQSADLPVDFNKYDLVYYAGYNLLTKASPPKEKTVTTLSGMTIYTPEQAAEFINKATACSIPNKQFLSAIQPLTDTKLFYIPNGVDTELFSPAKMPDGLILGWAGNSLRKGKRLDKLQKTAEELGIELRICDRDRNGVPHRQMPDFYRQLSCFCYVSESEGSSNPLLEAASCGIPIISTPTGNADDLVQNECGYLVKEDLSDLEYKINLMKLSDRKSMGQRIRQRILEDWTWEKRAKQYGEMFEYADNLRG